MLAALNITQEYCPGGKDPPQHHSANLPSLLCISSPVEFHYNLLFLETIKTFFFFFLLALHDAAPVVTFPVMLGVAWQRW